eukprot:m.206466 g.206466  ORF g.206466 m.206466 type:complete len:94 (-) comp15425_c0_seq16:3681-3962(-)
MDRVVVTALHVTNKVPHTSSPPTNPALESTSPPNASVGMVLHQWEDVRNLSTVTMTVSTLSVEKYFDVHNDLLMDFLIRSIRLGAIFRGKRGT